MYIVDIIRLVKDVKVNIEIIEKASGASFGFYTNKYVPIELLDKIAVEMNVQYVDGKAVVNGWYSQTTARHINEFLYQNGFDKMTKKQMEE